MEPVVEIAASMVGVGELGLRFDDIGFFGKACGGCRNVVRVHCGPSTAKV